LGNASLLITRILRGKVFAVAVNLSKTRGLGDESTQQSTQLSYIVALQLRFAALVPEQATIWLYFGVKLCAATIVDRRVVALDSFDFLIV
jgi:hypothetical protein